MRPNMQKFTVVLLRPNDDVGTDSYIAHVRANDHLGALAAARKEAAGVDNADQKAADDEGIVDDTTGELVVYHPEDYRLVVIFKGHLSGWWS